LRKKVENYRCKKLKKKIKKILMFIFRQAAQHIIAKLSEDPRGAALISSVASPNVKVTLNKSLSKIFLK